MLRAAGASQADADALIDAIRQPDFSASLALLKCAGQTIVDGRNPLVVTSLRSAWMISPKNEDRTRSRCGRSTAPYWGPHSERCGLSYLRGNKPLSSTAIAILTVLVLIFGLVFVIVGLRLRAANERLLAIGKTATGVVVGAATRPHV